MLVKTIAIALCMMAGMATTTDAATTTTTAQHSNTISEAVATLTLVEALAAASDACVQATKMEGLWQQRTAHLKAKCMSLCIAADNHEFTACNQFDAACLEEAITTFTDRSDDDGNGRDPDDVLFELQSRRFLFMKKCPDVLLGGFARCFATGGEHAGYDEHVVEFLKQATDGDAPCVESCADSVWELNLSTTSTAYEGDGDDDHAAADLCAAYDATVLTAKLTCKAAGTCAAVDAAVTEADADLAAAIEAVGKLATEVLSVASDACVLATKIEGLCGVGPGCLSRAHKKGYDGYGYVSYGYALYADDTADADAAAADAADSTADLADLTDLACAEVCAALKAGTVYDDAAGADDNDSGGYPASDVCAAYDEAVAAAKTTCKAENTCTAVDAAVAVASTEQAAAILFVLLSGNTSQLSAATSSNASLPHHHNDTALAKAGPNVAAIVVPVLVLVLLLVGGAVVFFRRRSTHNQQTPRERRQSLGQPLPLRQGPSQTMRPRTASTGTAARQALRDPAEIIAFSAPDPTVGAHLDVQAASDAMYEEPSAAQPDLYDGEGGGECDGGMYEEPVAAVEPELYNGEGDGDGDDVVDSDDSEIEI
jgi:hypothetical protein